MPLKDTKDFHNSYIHFKIVNDYLKKLEQFPVGIQRAASILTERHLANWNEDLIKLTTDGIPLILEESPRLSSTLIEGGKKFCLIERDFFYPPDTWSHGYIRFIEDLSKKPQIQKQFILLCTKKSVFEIIFGEKKHNNKNSNSNISKAKERIKKFKNYFSELDFQVHFCDESIVQSELSNLTMIKDTIEIFNDSIALITGLPFNHSYRHKTLDAKIRILSKSEQTKKFLDIVFTHLTDFDNLKNF